jgi:hypothetical protein
LGRIDDARRAEPVGFTRLVQRGKKPPPQRFIPSVDGVEVTDKLTGLVWQRCAVGMTWNNTSRTCSGTATQFKWQGALAYIRANAKGGWRIPNIKELVSIVNYENLVIDAQAFPNTPKVPEFVSSTPMSWGGTYVQIVDFGDGGVDPADADHPTDTWLLRLVRRGRK